MFDIFRGKDRKVVWVETVADLATTREHMAQHAARMPVRYLVFSTRRGCVVAELESFAPARTRREEQQCR
jgi:hypothetical protein